MENKKKFNFTALFYIVGYHLFLLVALPLYFMSYELTAPLILWTVGLLFVTGVAVTAGYHRLYSHNCYKTRPLVEAVFLFFGSMATQGSAIQWCHDHRLHHAFIDKDKDPYSIQKGFWHAHVLWTFYRTEKVDLKVVSDLWRKPLLRFQHKFYPLCMVFSNVVVFLFVGWLLNDYWGAFLFTWWVRLFLLHHTTWSINSLAHFWGTQSYSQEHSAVDNYMISLLTYGEGYHNYHHTFAQDYRNGIRWYHFDPTKWLIWTLYKLGLASDLKKVNNYRIAKELLLEHKNLLLEKIQKSWEGQKDHLEKVTQDLVETLSFKLSQVQKLLESYKKLPKKEARSLLQEIRQRKKELKETLSLWNQFLRFINKLA